LDVWSQKADRPVRDTTAASSAGSKRNRRGNGAVRFVRIGKSDGHKARRTLVDNVKMFRRSLENRFVRIGK